MRRTVRHEEHGFVFCTRRQLLRNSRHDLCDIIALLLLPLPIDKRRTERHTLKPRLAFVEDFPLVGILDARDDVERDESDACTALFLEPLQRLFGRWIADALVLFHALDDDVRREGEHDLDGGMHAPHLLRHGVNRLLARLLERRAETHDEDGVTFLTVSPCGIVCHKHAEACGSLQSGARCLYFLMEFVTCMHHIPSFSLSS